MKRRHFFSTSAAAAAGLILPATAEAAAPASAWKAPKYKWDHSDLPNFRLRRLTRGPMHHFFGYYGISPWNRSESKMVCLESSFQDRLPESGETADIGLVDQHSGEFQSLTKTLAWNLQQGAMLHWNPLHPDEEIIYNDLIERQLTSVRLNVSSGRKEPLPRPVSAVSKMTKHALSLTFGRLSRLRKVVSYADAADPNPTDPHPATDGVFLIDLESNESRLVLSIDEIFEQAVKDFPVIAGRHMWFNHTDINPSGNRFLFLARTRDEDNRMDSAMYTASMDGSDARMVVPFGTGVSHFGWRNDEEIVATFRWPEQNHLRHWLFHDGQHDYCEIGEDFILDNGHCTFSADGRWMCTDRKQDESRSQSLWLFDIETDKGMILVNLPVKEWRYLHSDTRCDFHPRWNPAGNRICFDAVDTATQTRQMHLIEFQDM